MALWLQIHGPGVVWANLYLPSFPRLRTLRDQELNVSGVLAPGMGSTHTHGDVRMVLDGNHQGSLGPAKRCCESMRVTIPRVKMKQQGSDQQVSGVGRGSVFCRWPGEEVRMSSYPESPAGQQPGVSQPYGSRGFQLLYPPPYCPPAS